MKTATLRPAGDNLKRHAVWPYVQIARPEHWFKNVFMILGVLLAAFYDPHAVNIHSLPTLLVGLVATCLVASANYTINELLDGPLDRLHPTKHTRPVPSGQVRPALAVLQWVVLTAVGLGLASRVNLSFALTAATLWLMGLIYNVRPVRAKEWAYFDVLVESINNPLRLLLGWFCILNHRVAPVSLMLAYWMAGAFFMATKRFAELRMIGDRAVASAYRQSFRSYTETSLLVSMVFYACFGSVFIGIFALRYHFELVLFTPLAAGLFAFYFRLGLLPDSPTQNPERLYHHKAFMLYLIVTLCVFVLLMRTSMPSLYDWFNVEPAPISPLWTFGQR